MKEFSAEEIKYLQEHADQEAATLMLQAGRYPNLPVALLVQQIQARQKARYKLPTWYREPQIRYPATLSVEQSSSEKTASYKASLVQGDALVDLTGGFGVDSYFFARHFRQVCYVERQAALCQAAAYNARVLGAANIHFHQDEARAFLESFPGPADVIYLDPARRDLANKKVHLLADCEPDILDLLPLLLAKSRQVLLKTSPMLDIHLALQQLPQVQQVHVVAVDNECKEVLYLLGPDSPPSPPVTAVNLVGENQQQAFTFSQASEDQAPVTYAQAGTFLYEPHAAIMKAGGFRSLASYLQLAKLHRNSHLYTSDSVIENFPGRVFRRLATCRYHKKELLALLPDKKANITVRNFPDTVAQIRAKTGLKEGGSHYLLATTDLHNKPVILVCEKAS
ncbi:MAG: THUMP-like domain-containing protein [Adhaeribacter sp.]